MRSGGRGEVLDVSELKLYENPADFLIRRLKTLEIEDIKIEKRLFFRNSIKKSGFSFFTFFLLFKRFLVSQLLNPKGIPFILIDQFSFIIFISFFFQEYFADRYQDIRDRVEVRLLLYFY